MTEAELDRAGEAIFNLERALFVREGRTRADDEAVIPFFQQGDFTKGIPLDDTRFRRLMDEYYQLRGWDPKSGVPRRSKLRQLGLTDVAKELEASELLPE
jgi:aldehyde:ferredoxin oxidoreductase